MEENQVEEQEVELRREYHREKAKNECELRKRAVLTIPKLMFAFFLHAPLIIIWRLMKVFIILSLGTRPSLIKWKQILRPFESSGEQLVNANDIFGCENKWTVNKEKEYHRRIRKLSVITLTIWIVSFIFLVFFSGNSLKQIAFSGLIIIIGSMLIIEALQILYLHKSIRAKNALEKQKWNS